MDTKRFFLYFIVIAALALAGCGGNGGGAQTAMPDPDPEPPMTCPDGQTGTPPNCVTPGPTVEDLFKTAQNSRDAADKAVMDARDAVKAAMDASEKIEVLDVKGNSMLAKMNADAVLAAQTTTNNAVMVAEQAETDLMEAETDAADHDDDTLNRAIAAALEVAEQAVTDTKAEAEGSDLRTAVEKVTGDDPDAEGYPRNAIQVGEDVAMQIGMALMPTSTADGGGIRVADLVTTEPASTVTGVTRMDDHKGSTWEEIVGSSNVMDKRIVDPDTAGQTKLVKAMSVSGMALTSGQDELAAAAANNGTQVNTGIEYKGIDGLVFCAGNDCAVELIPQDPDTTIDETTLRKLVGSWYFTPDDPDEFYVKDGMTYEVETMYARYGHWLTQAANAEGDLETTINTYALIGNTATNTDALVVDGSLTDTSAMYMGKAAGMSFRKTFDSDGKVVDGSRQSGAFTADVELTATFGGTPTLRGTIDNFVSTANADAVDSTWSVNLLPGTLAVTGLSATGTTVASGQNGEWTGTAYGVSGERPTGIFGGFNAHFSNGHAAGAYATRKQ